MIGKISAVIWDLDGVLIDSEELHIDKEIETLKKYGINITREIAGEYLGIKLEDYFNDIIRRFGKVNISLNELLKKHYETLFHYYKSVFPLMPHITEVLKTLKTRYSMGLVTSREKELANLVLIRFSLFKFFKEFVYSEDVQKAKPDPEPYLKVCSLLNIEPASAVAIEDSVSGFKSAKNAGMNLIAIKSSHNTKQDFSFADFVVEDLRKILEILKVNG